MEPIAARILFLTVGKKPRIDSLSRLKYLYPHIKIDFTPDELDLLQTTIQQRSQEMSHLIQQYQALSVMLRNLAVGFLLLSILEFTKLLLNSTSSHATFAILALLISVVAVSRSNVNRMWSYNVIFETALEYGSSLQEVLNNSSYRRNTPMQMKPVRTKANYRKKK